MNFWKPLDSFLTQGVTLLNVLDFLLCYHGQIAALARCLAGLGVTEMVPEENLPPAEQIQAGLLIPS